MQNRLKINKKSLNQFQNGLRRIGIFWLKQGQKTKKTKKIQEALKYIFESKIKLFKKKPDLLKTALVNVQKRKKLFKKENSKYAESLKKWV